MKTIIHRKQDIIDIVRYLLQNYDSKFEFIVEPTLCWGHVENGLGVYANTPVWVMRVKFSQGYEADGRYTEASGRLLFSTAYNKTDFDIFRRTHCKPLGKVKKMTLKDDHRKWVFGVDADGEFVRTDFLHFASTEKQVLRWFQRVYPHLEPQFVDLRLLETGQPIWVISATNSEWIGASAKVYFVHPIGFISRKDNCFMDLSPEVFDIQKEYFLCDPHRAWIGCVRHVMGVKWEKRKGLTPLTLSQMTQLPALGSDRYDSNSPACRSILD